MTPILSRQGLTHVHLDTYSGGWPRSYDLAEGGGFEPPEVSLNGFQDRHNRPLCQPSNRRFLPMWRRSVQLARLVRPLPRPVSPPATRVVDMRIMDIDGDRLTARTLPDPEPGPDEVLIAEIGRASCR